MFWKWLQVDAPEEPTGKKVVPFLRYYRVFNVAQCEDIPPDKIPALGGSAREHSPIVEAERIVSAMPKRPEIRHGGNRACYSASLDRVDMPQPEKHAKLYDLLGENGIARGHALSASSKPVPLRVRIP